MVAAVPEVQIIEDGRAGQVIYREGTNEITCYWEFGGGDVIAIVQAGSEEHWRSKYPWAADRRTEILWSIGQEVIRQRVPGGQAEWDERTGDLLIRNGALTAQPHKDVKKEQARRDAVAWYERRQRMKMKLGVVVLIGGLLAALFFWVKKTLFVVDPGKGSPFDVSIRTDTHIATLILTLDPFTPSLDGSHVKDNTYSLGLFLVPLDGSQPSLVPVVGERTGGDYRLGKIMGTDGRTLWIKAAGLYGVDLKDHTVISAKELSEKNPSIGPEWWEDTRGMEVNGGHLRIPSRDYKQMLEIDPGTLKAAIIPPQRSNQRPFQPVLTEYMAAGFYASPSGWLGLHSTTEMEKSYAPKDWVRPVERAVEAKEMRRLYRGELDPSSDDENHKILSIAPLGDAEYLNAAFLRMSDDSEPIRMADPEGAIMMYTSAPGLRGTLMLARIDTAGRVIWSSDTNLDRFLLQQIMPGEKVTAFVGTRLPEENKVSEPLLVIVENSTGRTTTHSLWQ